MTKTMTEGNPLRLILEFAVPLMLGNLLQQTYNIVDAAIVGQVLGTSALASVGATSSVQFLVIGFLVGTTCGFGIPIAKTFGAEDCKRLRIQIFHAYILSGVVAIILTMLCTLFCSKILFLLSTPEEIYADAYRYLFVLFLGIPFTLLYNLLSAILRAVGDSKMPFFFLAFSTVLNIILDLLFIKVIRWGCVGAAVATVTAQAVSGILCAYVIGRRYQILCLKREDCRLHPTEIRNMIVMGIPMVLQYS
ncbi:MAG: polysaccharide biosynthesis C-terminal domain-containing protein, partial [Lachnospiraceae bacterium]|nr:polysaccharide biosynthesis C-terminal domain-containing protein [Lachnospiraceae bacterium]